MYYGYLAQTQSVNIRGNLMDKLFLLIFLIECILGVIITGIAFLLHPVLGIVVGVLFVLLVVVTMVIYVGCMLAERYGNHKLI